MTQIFIDKISKNKYIMAGDRRITDGTGNYYIDPNPKIRKIGKTLVGGAGDSTQLEIFLNLKELTNLDKASDPYNYILSELIPKFFEKLRKIDPNKDHEDNELLILDSSFLIATHGKVFNIDIDKKVECIEISVPAAIGCGSNYTMSAYNVLTKVLNTHSGEFAILAAMETCANLNHDCDNNIDIIKGGN